MIALAESSTITFSIVGLIIALAVIALLRVVLRKEPSPATWRRIRLGFFIERDPKGGDDEQTPDV